VLVILIIAGFILFLTMNSMKKSDVSDAGDPGADQNPLGIVGSDSTPMGDTNEHAGEQTDEGTTVGGQDAGEHGGTGGPRSRFGRSEAGVDSPNVARPVVGGEGEGERSTR